MAGGLYPSGRSLARSDEGPIRRTRGLPLKATGPRRSARSPPVRRERTPRAGGAVGLPALRRFKFSKTPCYTPTGDTSQPKRGAGSYTHGHGKNQALKTISFGKIAPAASVTAARRVLHASRGLAPAGGRTAAAGGRSAAAGGRSAAAGGRSAAAGGRSAATGGRSAATGGRSAATGGRSAAAGGRSAPAGGRTAATGGRTAAVGGRTAASGETTFKSGGPPRFSGRGISGGSRTPAARGGLSGGQGWPPCDEGSHPRRIRNASSRGRERPRFSLE
jgi:hypothetical protein